MVSPKRSRTGYLRGCLLILCLCPRIIRSAALPPLLPPPRIIELHHAGRVRESVPVGTVIYSLKTSMNRQENDQNVDQDVDRKFSVYRTMMSPELSRFLHVQPETGDVIVRKALNRDNMNELNLCPSDRDCRIAFTVVDEQAQQIYRVNIDIEDVNDNKPEFPAMALNFTIAENVPVGYRYRLEEATDKDVGENGRITYKLLTSPTSSLHPNPAAEIFRLVTEPFLSLEVAQPLDFEQTKSYVLTLIAMDNGHPTLSSSVKLYIDVEDTNDNNPKCAHQKTLVTVAEDTPLGTVVARVQATDEDHGDNGKLVYELKESKRKSGPRTGSTNRKNDKFSVNRNTGDVVVIDQLDYEQQKDHYLEVMVRDHGTGSSPAVCTVHVKVKNVNDHAPTANVEIFSKYLSTQCDDQSKTGHYCLTLSENLKPNSFIGQINVEDRDAADGEDGVITTNLTCTRHDTSLRQWVSKPSEKGNGNQNPLTINCNLNSTCFLYSTKLDRESTDAYICDFVASDHGSPVKTSTTYFKINLMDVNDNAPVFVVDEADQILKFNVKENRPRHTLIAKLPVSDADKENSLNTELIFAVSSNKFYVDDLTGNLYTAAILDREKVSKHDFTITVSDAGSPPLSSSVFVQVNVIDDNDNKPVFRFPSYNFSIREDAPVGTVVGTVHAVDLDQGMNGKVTYRFCGGTETMHNMPFEVLKNGTIMLNGPIDYETKSLYKGRICAEDSGSKLHRLQSRVNVMFLVQNTNDNCPELHIERHTMYVNKDLPMLNWRVDFSLIDKDGDENKLQVKTDSKWARVTSISPREYYISLHPLKDPPPMGHNLVNLYVSDSSNCSDTYHLVLAVGNNQTDVSAKLLEASNFLAEVRKRSSPPDRHHQRSVVARLSGNSLHKRNETSSTTLLTIVPAAVSVAMVMVAILAFVGVSIMRGWHGARFLDLSPDADTAGGHSPSSSSFHGNAMSCTESTSKFDGTSHPKTRLSFIQGSAGSRSTDNDSISPIFERRFPALTSDKLRTSCTIRVPTFISKSISNTSMKDPGRRDSGYGGYGGIARCSNKTWVPEDGPVTKPLMNTGKLPLLPVIAGSSLRSDRHAYMLRLMSINRRPVPSPDAWPESTKRWTALLAEPEEITL